MRRTTKDGNRPNAGRRTRPRPPTRTEAEAGPTAEPSGIQPLGDMRAQGELVRDGRLPAPQRQAAASQVGRVLGNRQLQAIATLRAGQGQAAGARAPLTAMGLLALGAAVRMAVQAKNGDKKEGPKTPLELLRDELGDIFVDERACLGWIAQLGPQVSTVRNDKWLMGEMAAAFNAAEMLQAVRQLAMELKWAIYWIDRAREAGSIGSKGYDTLIASSSAKGNAELIGWSDMLGVVKTNRPGNPLTLFPPLLANNPVLAWVFGAYGHFVDWILTDAGGQQLLHFLLGHNPKGLVGGLDKSGRWTPFLSKLPKGTGLAPADKAALHNLAGNMPDVKHQAELFEIRFDVSATKGGVGWEPKGLMRAWQMLTVLPVSDVEGNPKLDLFLRAGKGDTSGESDMSTYVKYWYNANKLGQLDVKSYTDPTDPMNKMNIFDLTIIHEVGHAVDGAYKFSNSYCKTTPGGGWKGYTPEEAVDAMVAASPWKLNLPKAPAPKAPAGKKEKTWGDWVQAGLEFVTEVAWEASARQACVQAASNRKTVRSQANAIDPKGTLWKAMKHEPVAKAIGPAFEEQAPWMNHGKQVRFGSRYYHEGYKGFWVSYLSDRYDAKLSKYQFRDPRDWFAEVYACYYGTVNPSAPRSEDAGTKVPEPIKAWFRTHVAKVAPPPGAKKAGP